MFETLLVYISFLHLCYASNQGLDNSCQLLYTYGYGYRQFYHLPLSSINLNGSIHLEFSVKASSDAHILLATKPDPVDSDPVYEIVLGAGRNTFSEIRRLRKDASRSTVMTRNILSHTEMKKFWVNTKNFKNGNSTNLVIKVGEENQSPFLQWSDSSPLNISYMSFCTWTGVSGKWAYDCQGASPVIKPKTKLMSLKDDLFDKYDPFLLPYVDDNIIEVTTEIIITHLELSLSTSTLKVVANFILNWFDTRLQWNPEKYRNITLLKITEREIWQPSLVLYNGKNNNKEVLSQGILTLSNTGDVRWSSTCNAEVWCSGNLERWPLDTHICNLKMGVHADSDVVTLKMLKTNVFHTDMQGWKLVSLENTVKKSYLPWQSILNEDLPGYKEANIMTVKLTIKRQSEAITSLIYIPFWATILMSLVPLTLPPKNKERTFIHFSMLTIFVMQLLSIDTLIPKISYPPHIVIMCGYLILIIAITTVVSLWLVIKATSEPEDPPPAFICEMLELPIVSLVLPIKISEHTRMEDESKSFTESDGQLSNYWIALISLVDRLLLISVLSSYAVIIIA